VDRADAAALAEDLLLQPGRPVAVAESGDARRVERRVLCRAAGRASNGMIVSAQPGRGAPTDYDLFEC
jgi:hypothetical protein